jgi:hypothetical protein
MTGNKIYKIIMLPTIVYPNMPIGQIVFHEVKGLISDTYDKKEVNYNNLFSEKPEPVKPNLHKKINPASAPPEIMIHYQ